MLDTSTKTLGVNGAFLSEIKEDHFELRDLLCKTDRAFEQRQRHRKPRELVYLLLALQDRLALHFSLEEAYGYCEDALEVAPRLGSKAAALRAQHQTLFVDFCHLVDDAEQLLAPIPMSKGSAGKRRISLVQIAARYEQFREALDEHERARRRVDLGGIRRRLGRRRLMLLDLSSLEPSMDEEFSLWRC